MEPDSEFSLAAVDSITAQIQVTNAARLAVTVIATNWGTAVAELEWSLDGENYHSFSTAITFSTSNKAELGVDVNTARWVRVRTTTADGSADTAAKLYTYGSIRT